MSAVKDVYDVVKARNVRIPRVPIDVFPVMAHAPLGSGNKEGGVSVRFT